VEETTADKFAGYSSHRYERQGGREIADKRRDQRPKLTETATPQPKGKPNYRIRNGPTVDPKGHCPCCGCRGHRARECLLKTPPRDDFVPPGQRPPPLKSPYGEASFVVDDDTGEGLGVNLFDTTRIEDIGFSNTAFLATSTDELVFDTGCNMHLTPNRDILHDFKPVKPGRYIRWGGGERAAIQGYGDILFTTQTNSSPRIVSIPDVAETSRG
jgi:hypothetical protein